MKLRNILCWLKLGKLTFISISAKTIAACVALKHSPDMLPGYWQQHVLHIITLCGKIGCSKYSNTANPCKHASSFNKPLKCHSGFKLKLYCWHRWYTWQRKIFPEHWIWQTEFSWHATAQQHLHSRLSSHCLVQSASVCHNHVVLSQLRTCLLSLVPIEQQHSGPLITDVSLDVCFEARILRILSYLQFWATLLNCIYVKKKEGYNILILFCFFHHRRLWLMKG